MQILWYINPSSPSSGSWRTAGSGTYKICCRELNHKGHENEPAHNSGALHLLDFSKGNPRCYVRLMLSTTFFCVDKTRGQTCLCAALVLHPSMRPV